MKQNSGLKPARKATRKKGKAASKSDRQLLDVINAVLEIEFRISEAVGITGSPSYAKDVFTGINAAPPVNLSNNKASVFHSDSNEAAIAHAKSLGDQRLRAAVFLSAKQPQRLSDPKAPGTYVLHVLSKHGAPNCAPLEMQLSSWNAQSAADLSIIAHRITETINQPCAVFHQEQDANVVQFDEVAIPSIARLQAYFQSESVEQRLPSNAPVKQLLFDDPESPGKVSLQAKSDAEISAAIQAVCSDAMRRFDQLIGRKYGTLQHAGDAEPELVIVATGSRYMWLSGRVRSLARKLGRRLKIINPILFSPFPYTAILEFLSSARWVVLLAGDNNAQLRAGFYQAIEQADANGRAQDAGHDVLPYPGLPARSGTNASPRIYCMNNPNGFMDSKHLIRALSTLISEPGLPSECFKKKSHQLAESQGVQQIRSA